MFNSQCPCGDTFGLCGQPYSCDHNTYIIENIFFKRKKISLNQTVFNLTEVSFALRLNLLIQNLEVAVDFIGDFMFILTYISYFY